jgi:hypothetical protein
MPLTVICVGYPRTGTVSMKTALEQLGIKPCYHMSEVIAKPDHWPLWIGAFDGVAQPWDRIFESYSAAADAPTCFFYEELARHFAKARIILTTRDAGRWYDSTQSTVLSPGISLRFKAAPAEFNNLLLKMGWHPDDPATHDRSAMIGKFLAHNAAVKRAIAPSRLLVFEPSQGWAPLCGVLGQPVPEGPFPHINSTEEFNKMMEGLSGLDPEGVSRSLKQQAARHANRG